MYIVHSEKLTEQSTVTVISRYNVSILSLKSFHLFHTKLSIHFTLIKSILNNILNASSDELQTQVNVFTKLESKVLLK